MFVKRVPPPKILSHISKTWASNIDLFGNRIHLEIRLLKIIAKDKINDNFKIIEKPKNGDLIESTDEALT